MLISLSPRDSMVSGTNRLVRIFFADTRYSARSCAESVGAFSTRMAVKQMRLLVNTAFFTARKPVQQQ